MKFGEELIKMEKELKNIQNDQHSLAYELILESKKKAKRDFVVIVVLAVLLFISNIIWLVGFLYYESQFDVYGELIQEVSDNQNSIISQEANN
jgi:hypothetical protein